MTVRSADSNVLRPGRQPNPAATSDARELAGLKREMRDLQDRYDALTEKAQALEEAAMHAGLRIVELENIVAGYQASTSWRATHPLRLIRSGVSSLRRPASVARSVLRPPLIWAMRKTLARPKGRRLALRMVSRVPGLEARLRRIGARAGLIEGVPDPALATTQLCARASRIHRRILAASARRNS